MENVIPNAPDVNAKPTPAADAGRLMAIADAGKSDAADRYAIACIVNRYADVLGDAIYADGVTVRMLAIMIARLN